MRKLLLICILTLFIEGTTSAQNIESTQPSQKSIYEYYIRLKAIHSRNDVIQMQQLIQQKPGVVYFMANRFPVRYFRLKSEIPITPTILENWLGNSAYQITSFGMGTQAKENAILQYNKSKSGR